MIGIAIANSLGLNKLSVINPDAQAFLTAAGITGTTQVDAVNTLVNGLQQDGLWSKMKAIYPFVTDNRNLLSYTNDFSNAIWQGSPVTSGQADPFGGTNAILCSVEKWQSFNYTTLTQYAISIYAKAGTTSTFTFGSDSTPNYFCTFNLSTQSITNSTGYTGSMTSIGNGWYRCTVTWKKDSGGALTQPFYDFKPTNGGMYFYGTQLELGSTATTYQPIATTQQAYISSQFKYNLKDPRDLDAAFRLVFNGGWTHSSTGATPNGTNGYADTKLNANTNLTNGNFHLSFYSRTNSSLNLFSAEILMLATYSSLGWVNLRTNDKVSGQAGVTFGNDTTEGAYASSTTSGYMVASETSNSLRKVFKNNSLLAQNTTTSTTALTSSNLTLSGSPVSNYSANQIAFVSMGDGLTDTEAANIYTRVQAFQTALSRQV